jgi:ribosome-associated heat shock protein Hsp15
MRDDRQRLDKWLWFARFAKTRPAAVRLVEDGHVRVEGRRVDNPAQALKLGDVLTLALPHATIVVRLQSLGERRGPFEQARLLYERLDELGRGDPSLAEENDDG